MSATNDPSAIYGLHREGREPKEPAKREPMLSDDMMNEQAVAPDGLSAANVVRVPKWTAWDVREFYEAKITSGELIVRNKCAKCDNLWTPTFITKDRCPGCGQYIDE